MPRFIDQFPWLKPIAAKFEAGMANDPDFVGRFHRGKVDLDGRPIARSPDAVARVKQSKLRAGRTGFLANRAIGPTKSFVGGRPDEPASFVWPSWQGRNLIFLAQLDLAALPNRDHFEWLPASGRLLFFSGHNDLAEFSPEISRIIHVPETSYIGTTPDEERNRQYLSFERHNTYPALGPEDELRQADDNYEVMDWFDGLVLPQQSALWQLGGWPERWQSDDMRRECERLYRGLASDHLGVHSGTSFQKAMDTWHMIGQFDLATIVEQPSGFTCGLFWVKVENGEALFDKAVLIGRWG